MGPANAIELLTQQRKSPWRSKFTPPGPRGLHPAGALARTHQNLKKQTPIPTGQVSTKPQQTLRGSARTPPEARGLLSDTIKRGTLSKNQKDRLNLTNIKAKGQSQGLGRFSDSPEARIAMTLHLAEALSC